MGTFESICSLCRSFNVRRNMIKVGIYCAILFILIQNAEARRRDPRLFFVTTESSTLSTTTMFWSINNAGCTGHSGGQCRRRRSISEDINIDGLEEINPSESVASVDLDSSLDWEQEGNNDRQGRQNNALNWLLYWATTTLTTTSFTTTKTLTIPVPAGCTPAGMSCCSA